MDHACGDGACIAPFSSRGKQAFHSPAALKRNRNSKLLLASDALPLPVGLTNKLFLFLFFAASYFLLQRWGEKKKSSIPLHNLSFLEIVAVLVQISSIIYLWGFFGIVYVQNYISKCEDDREVMIDSAMMAPSPCSASQCPTMELKGQSLTENADDDISYAVSAGKVPSHALEQELGDCARAASVRKHAVEIITGRSLESLPLSGFDYASVLGQCCEMVIGYIQIPVGVVGPLLLDGIEYMVPMATTEGCLVASTNRGCKAIHLSGGASSVLLQDGMTRAPVVRFASASRAAEIKLFLDCIENFETLSMMFNKSSRFARLQNIQTALVGRNMYLRFKCFTGDAMGMNMVSKGVQNVLDYLQHVFPDMEIVSISGNFCADKKATAINWIQGRGKSVVCEATIKEEVVRKVLKTTVPALVELNVLKNLTGSAIAGALGGFNAHASNIVSAVFLATGQDPAQNVESSQCITLMEPSSNGHDLYVSVTIPSLEVGTVGGGTQLASQAACLNMLGLKGANTDMPGGNAQRLARIIAGSVLAGELSLMSALAAGHLVKSHLKYNRSSKDMAALVDGSSKV